MMHGPINIRSDLSSTFCSPDEILLNLSSEAGKIRIERGIEPTVFVLNLPAVLSEGKLKLLIIVKFFQSAILSLIHP